MIRHTDLTDRELYTLLKSQQIQWGGNAKLKIYGRLDCTSGKRMKRQNRVFFLNEQQALAQQFRPCGHCMRAAYRAWKNGFI